MKKSLLYIVMMGAFCSNAVYAETNAPEPTTTATQNTQPIPPKPPTPTHNKAKTTQTQQVAKTQQSAAPQTETTASANNASAVATEPKQTVVLQLGAFTDPNLAYKQAAKVSLLGVPAKVVRVKNRNGDIVRVVRSSKRLKQADAEKTAADLREQQVNVLLMQ